MGKNEKTPITVNDIEYFVDDMTDEERTMLNHVTDLERKLANARFNIDQLALAVMRLLICSHNRWKHLKK
jgi:hypothetical protein